MITPNKTRKKLYRLRKANLPEAIKLMESISESIKLCRKIHEGKCSQLPPIILDAAPEIDMFIKMVEHQENKVRQTK